MRWKRFRQLLADAKPGVKLPPAIDAADTTPQPGLTPETYLAVGKVVNYGGGGTYDEGAATFEYPPALKDNSFALTGPWSLDYQGATADGDNSAIKLNYQAKNVYIVAGGTGTLTVTRNGKPTTVPISASFPAPRRTSCKISNRRAPSAMRTPISWVRSPTT